MDRAVAQSLAYAARRIPEITDSVEAIDNAMKWGYAWDLGPFEVWDALGFAATTDRMKQDGVALPAWVEKMRAAARPASTPTAGSGIRSAATTPRATDPREVTFEIMRKGDAPVLKNGGAEAWDLGDGVLGLTFKTKANSIDADVIKMIHDATDARRAGLPRAWSSGTRASSSASARTCSPS